VRRPADIAAGTQQGGNVRELLQQGFVRRPLPHRPRHPAEDRAVERQKLKLRRRGDRDSRRVGRLRRREQALRRLDQQRFGVERMDGKRREPVRLPKAEASQQRLRQRSLLREGAPKHGVPQDLRQIAAERGQRLPRRRRAPPRRRQPAASGAERIDRFRSFGIIERHAFQDVLRRLDEARGHVPPVPEPPFDRLEPSALPFGVLPYPCDGGIQHLQDARRRQLVPEKREQQGEKLRDVLALRRCPVIGGERHAEPLQQPPDERGQRGIGRREDGGLAFMAGFGQHQRDALRLPLQRGIGQQPHALPCRRRQGVADRADELLAVRHPPLRQRPPARTQGRRRGGVPRVRGGMSRQRADIEGDLAFRPRPFRGERRRNQQMPVLQPRDEGGDLARRVFRHRGRRHDDAPPRLPRLPCQDPAADHGMAALGGGDVARLPQERLPMQA
jgi:hypothetical protein